MVEKARCVVEAERASKLVEQARCTEAEPEGEADLKLG
jgi:hypothetical protein